MLYGSFMAIPDTSVCSRSVQIVVYAVSRGKNSVYLLPKQHLIHEKSYLNQI